MCILEHVHACLCVRESVCVRARECEGREESVRVKCLGDDIGLLAHGRRERKRERNREI